MVPTGVLRLLLALFVMAPADSASTAAREPIDVIRVWLFQNDMGWFALMNGDLTLAEARFKAAIKVVRPYEKSDPRLMARSYCVLALVLYQQARYDQAEPLAKWALQVRERVPGIYPDTIYQNLYVLAQIHCAQRRFKDAEPL